jgi:hypothetical protein
MGAKLLPPPVSKKKINFGDILVIGAAYNSFGQIPTLAVRTFS